LQSIDLGSADSAPRVRQNIREAGAYVGQGSSPPGEQEAEKEEMARDKVQSTKSYPK
jgi:hypothetical protein